jgi:ATP synthase protein I
MADNNIDKQAELEKKISKFKKIDDKIDRSSEARSQSLAMRIITDLAAAIFVGLAIGYLIDEAADTKPVFLLIFLTVGIAAGFLNVYRAAMKESESSDK